MNYLEFKEGVLFKIRTSKVVRALVYPYMNFKRVSGKRKYAHTPDAAFIRSLKDTKKGKRCFIIGNGPSLTAADLDKLQAEDTFAFNRIYYMFDRTDWRPTYYMCVDVGVLGMNLPEIEKLGLPTIILSDIARKNVKKQADNIHYLYDFTKFKLNRWAFDPPYISEDCSDHFCLCFTVTFDAIQLAIYMGYTEIYLLGVDHSYSVTADAKGRIKKDESVRDYFEGLEKTAITAQNYEATTAAFNVARVYADAHGITIKNATRGGKLEAFERVEFDTLFEM